MTGVYSHMAKKAGKYLALIVQSFRGLDLYSIPIFAGLVFLAQLGRRRAFRSSTDHQVRRSGLITARTRKGDEE
jgi:hypothetical protein